MTTRGSAGVVGSVCVEGVGVVSRVLARCAKRRGDLMMKSALRARRRRSTWRASWYRRNSPSLGLCGARAYHVLSAVARAHPARKGGIIARARTTRAEDAGLVARTARPSQIFPNATVRHQGVERAVRRTNILRAHSPRGAGSIRSRSDRASPRSRKDSIPMFSDGTGAGRTDLIPASKAFKKKCSRSSTRNGASRL